ncbi:MAG: TIGR01620 family protein [Rhizobiaceae bacterium]|nr:TIGR01620 family protein [Rhizobiaceae bacterium]
MTTQRKPAAFRIDAPEPEPQATRPARRPRAMPRETAVVVPAEVDVFDDTALVDADPPLPVPSRRRSWLGGLFFGSLGVLVSLALGLWADQLIRDLFQRNEWLGWVAAAAAALAVIAALTVFAREMLALSRLSSVEKLRSAAEAALASDDPKAARVVVDRLSALMADRPETAAGRKMLDALRDDIVDGANLIRLAETEILTGLDERATTMVLNAAKRVSMVTAVSPRAVVDVGYVIFESGRLIRRIAELYGGRPGTLGFFRLARGVLSHLAVTGSIAVGDSFVQQIVGHGLAARLSAKLGEGVVNGMMTARIGLAAIDTARPLPFSARKRPGVGDFLSALTSFAANRKDAPDA